MKWIRKAWKALARRARSSVIDRFTIEIGLDVDHSGLDAMAARTEELHARWTDITAMIESGKPFGIAPGSSVARFDVGVSDTIILSVPTVLRAEQREHRVEQLGAVFGNGPRVIVLDGGATITHLVAAAPSPPAAERVTIRRANGAPCREMLAGVETRISIDAYKLWLKGEGNACEHDHQPDRFGPAGQYICTYCRDIKRTPAPVSAP